MLYSIIIKKNHTSLENKFSNTERAVALSTFFQLREKGK
jgi:hypothetical protein